MANIPIHFEIPADAPAALGDFYTKVFGWQIEKTDNPEYWIIRTGPGEAAMNGGMMSRVSSEQQGVLLYIGVDSVDSFVDKVKANGGRIVMEKKTVPGMGWFALFADPQGTVLGLWQEDSSAG